MAASSRYLYEPYVASPPKTLTSQKVRKGGSRVARAAGQVLIQAMACGLSLVEARALVACNMGVAAAIVAEPRREAEIRRAADRATIAIVQRSARRRAA